jgi:hypothetical protein
MQASQLSSHMNHFKVDDKYVHPYLFRDAAYLIQRGLMKRFTLDSTSVSQNLI